MKDGVVLHTQKVAGISGSEAHLLQLLPDLRERGWEARFLMLHEDEPGAWEFARRAQRARGAAGRHPPAGRRRPGRFRRGGGVPRAPAAADPAHAPRPCGRLRPARRLAVPAFRSGSRRSTASTSSARGAGSGSRIDRSSSLAHVHVAISRGLAQYLAETEGFSEEDFEIVHYGISSSGDAEAVLEAEPRLVCVGRLIPIKGHLVLLRALARARARVPGVTLDVAGRGPLAPALKGYARELGLEEAIRFLGFVSPVEEAIEGGAIVVVPSLGEGFGMVALEAMERARPVIASSVGGLPEIVADGETGLVVPPADVDALADAIVALAADLPRAARMGAAGRVRALEQFTPERCCRADRGALPARAGRRTA